MKVGLTYDLRDQYLATGLSPEMTAEFDGTDTIESIQSALRELGFDTDQIGNIRDLVQRLSAGDRWDLVFNIAEGLRGFGREAQVPALLDAYDIPYTFSDPLVLSLTLHKGLTKRVIRDLGLPTPDFAVIESEADIDKTELRLPLFAKPVAEGTGKGIASNSLIRSREDVHTVCRELLTKFTQPVLLEQYLPGREFTVGIVGTGDRAESVGTMEIVLRDTSAGGIYSFVSKEYCEELVSYKLTTDKQAGQAAELALAVWSGLGCRDAGRVDIRLDEAGVPNFMEVNPLAGLHPEHSDLPIICGLTGIGYTELISRIMTSALERIGAGQTVFE
ncbi:D-alanine--D-alanine ligase [candidate division KSB1 bacterium]